MKLYEIMAIILIVTFLSSLLVTYIYKRKHNIPTGECAYCKSRMNRMVKELRKEYKKNKLF